MTPLRAQVLLLSMALAGCAWVPDGGQFATDRGVIPVDLQAGFVSGVSLREDVVCQLGEPDWTSIDETRMVYRVRDVRSQWFAYMVGGVAVVAFCDIRSHLFEFGTNGTLLDYRVAEESRRDGGDGAPDPLWREDLDRGVDFATYFDSGS